MTIRAKRYRQSPKVSYGKEGRTSVSVESNIHPAGEWVRRDDLEEYYELSTKELATLIDALNGHLPKDTRDARRRKELADRLLKDFALRGVPEG